MTAVIAMMFLMLTATLALSMFSVATVGVAGADNLAQAERARANAESGLRWMAWRMVKMNRPRTAVGMIDDAEAALLWVSGDRYHGGTLTAAINADLATLMTPAERPCVITDNSLTTSRIAVDNLGGAFVITINQHPLDGGDPLDRRYLRVTSTGCQGQTRRAVFMDFKIDKKIKYAVIGKVPIQLGRNVLVEGPVAMATTLKPNNQSPIFSLSDFRDLNSSMRIRSDAFKNFLKNNYAGYDNRIAKTNATLFAAASSAGFADTNSDGHIDEFDLFLREFDSNADGAVSSGTGVLGSQLANEFYNSSTHGQYDSELLGAIDSLGGPLFGGDVIRLGYRDGVVASNDGYAKVRGTISVAESSDALISRLRSNNQTIQDVIQGPIVPMNPGDTPVKFGLSMSDIFDLSPSNFDTSGFAAMAGVGGGAAVVQRVRPDQGRSIYKNYTVGGTDATGLLSTSGQPVLVNGQIQKVLSGDPTPYGSTSIQAKYDRPVFTNVDFKNCVIAKGTNALFRNCTFSGVTFVEMSTNITNSSGKTSTNKDDGMWWSKRMKSGYSFSTNTSLNAVNSYGFTDGNNLRFENCAFAGPLISSVPTAYSHFTNSWEFCGNNTVFDMKSLDPSDPDNEMKKTATIIAPQTNIEMGSFTLPGQASSTLKGVVVAGNIDIRGSATVDGSVLITGDGAGNTTLGWFGLSDGSTDPDAPMPEGGYGRLNLRYNPYRALPDGINVPIDILPDISTYQETTP